MLRSCSNWSAGNRHTEMSIQHAYLDLIKKSKHYIYIENQFFITSLPEDGVENTIGKLSLEKPYYLYLCYFNYHTVLESKILDFYLPKLR